jgi:UDP-N-acetylmuramoylalanine--D-glutamate ligase
VLLSPACASYDQFDSFEERGNTFKRLVSELATA